LLLAMIQLLALQSGYLFMINTKKTALNPMQS